MNILAKQRSLKQSKRHLVEWYNIPDVWKFRAFETGSQKLKGNFQVNVFNRDNGESIWRISGQSALKNYFFEK